MMLHMRNKRVRNDILRDVKHKKENSTLFWYNKRALHFINYCKTHVTKSASRRSKENTDISILHAGCHQKTPETRNHETKPSVKSNSIIKHVCEAYRDTHTRARRLQETMPNAASLLQCMFKIVLISAGTLTVQDVLSIAVLYLSL